MKMEDELGESVSKYVNRSPDGSSGALRMGDVYLASVRALRGSTDGVRGSFELLSRASNCVVIVVASAPRLYPWLVWDVVCSASVRGSQALRIVTWALPVRVRVLMLILVARKLADGFEQYR
jgi:hypothetical protein